MKKTILASIFVFTLLLIGGRANAFIITSTTSGGEWHDTLTWLLHAVPGDNDTVIINGNIHIYGYATCKKLTVNAGCILEDNVDHTLGLYINGDLINNGTIRDNPANTNSAALEVYVKGSVLNNSIMSNGKLIFNDTTDQHISGQPFDCKYIGKNPDGHIIATSNLVFDTLTSIDLSFDTLVMGSYKLTANSTNSANLRYGAISSSGEIDISGLFGCNLIGDITLGGSQPIKIANIGYTGGTIWAKGNITIAAGKTVEVPDYYGYNWQIIGNLTNNGTIRNNLAGNQLGFYITGDLVNNGVMTQQLLCFNGDSTWVQHIGGTHKFDCITINKNPDGHLTATSALVFDTLTSVDLSYDTLFMGSYKLTANSTVNANLRYGAISSNGEVDVSGPFGCNLIGDATLTGSQPIQVANIGYTGGGIWAKGNLTIASGKVLEVPNYYGFHWEVIGNLNNNGTIRNNLAGNQLTLYIRGNLVNNGVMTQQVLTFSGDSTWVQHIGGTHKFDCITINKIPYGQLFASSDLVFDTFTTVDLSYDTLDMGSYKLTANSNGSNFIKNGMVHSTGDIDISGPFGCDLSGNIRFTGNNPIQIVNPGSTGGGRTVYGNVTIDSGKILEVPNYYGYYLDAKGQFINFGIVRDNPNGNHLTLYLNGSDIRNKNTWTNYRTIICGNTDQVIYLIGNKSINSYTEIQSELSGSPYQWLKDSVAMPGETYSSLYLDSVTTQEYGFYRCKVNDTLLTRRVTICQYTPAVEEDAGKIGVYKLKLPENYPNPFVSHASISFGIPSEAGVKIKVYNCAGSEVRTLVDARMKAGYHTVTWDGRDNNGNKLTSGTYFYRFETGDVKATRKMMMLK